TVVVRSYTSDRVSVGGKTIAPRLGQTEAIVMVRSFAYAPPQVYIGGEVMRPGVLAHRRPLTLLQALFEAGGNRPTAELRSVLIMRKSGDEPLVIRRDIKKDLEGGAA
ncbi:SLBB domain-containing protein, partial [Salmonella enterica]|uniref:SLBB domain-containing protein n=1 Tax=Salmonella enterica TaxID=28901 RepID=UPI003FA737F1